jgi:hypothetical protein
MKAKHEVDMEQPLRMLEIRNLLAAETYGSVLVNPIATKTLFSLKPKTEATLAYNTFI